MEFGVLGPLELRDGGSVIELRGSKRRALLALLVLHANEVVRADRLIEDLWGEDRPANASGALQNHVSRLRKELGPDVLVTKPWGYVLRTDPDAVDLHRFEALVAEARPLAARERRTMLIEALALWRGPPLADLADEPALALEVARLQELRLSAVEQRIDADLELGDHEQLVPELEALVAQEPLRERLRGQLIVALYRSGRQAEALETYRETRRMLVEELGIEPGADLRDLERAILRQDPSLASGRPTPELVDVEAATSRWRWPRSPLVIATALLLMAGAGASGALIATGTGTSNEDRAAAAGASIVQNESSQPGQSQPATTSSTTKAAPGHPGKQSTSATTTRHATRPAKANSEPASRPGKAIAQPPATSSSRPRTRAQPQAPTKSPQTTVQRWYFLSDAFDDPAFDSGMWNRHSDGSGWDLAEQGGHLEVGLAGTSVPGDQNWSAGYGTGCRLLGDFDARVDFQLLAWPEQAGVSLYLGAWRKTSGVSISRFSNGGGDGYGASFQWYFVPAPSADLTGGLRLHRHNGLLAMEYRRGNRWVELDAAPFSGGVFVFLQLGVGTDFSHKAVRIAFDNFSAEAEGVNCSSGSRTPPRRPHHTF